MSTDLDFRCQAPLAWPPGKPRAKWRDRAQFGKFVANRGKQQLNVYEASVRIRDEVNSITRRGHQWRTRAVVLSTNATLTKQHWPNSTKEPSDPGACLYMVLDGQPITLPCDKWDRLADNLAAIAAHVKAMRLTEHWGVGELAQMFAGFAALPGATVVETWWDVLEVDRAAPHTDVLSARKRLLIKAHPDHGGCRESLDRIETAYGAFKAERGIE